MITAEERVGLPEASSAATWTRFPDPGHVLGAGSALAATFLPVPAPVAVALVVASELGTLKRAGEALVHRRLDGDVLEAATLGALVLARRYRALALLATLRSLGEYVVSKTVTTTRRSLRDVIAAPDGTVTAPKGPTSERCPSGPCGLATS